jgi:hypothetical protein
MVKISSTINQRQILPADDPKLIIALLLATTITCRKNHPRTFSCFFLEVEVAATALRSRFHSLKQLTDSDAKVSNTQGQPNPLTWKSM